MSRRSTGFAGIGAQDQPPGCAFSSAGLKRAEHGDGDRHRRGLGSLADEVQDAMSAQGLGVVLDADRGRFGGTQRVDAEQIGQGPVVDGDGLGDLEEPDEFEAVESLRP
ncbi:hypothetical protein [Nocardioides iriomotensis]|uniref:Uncharacterized protein n=1 Tax=Nocardioides iriomotensis TaxID=715784 RepID=A0A4Q5J743_9ACTN|nr:hypothetical protein [Nocardioides iriomotensis]RYU14343.1 hypothetical protein ETU37_03830 [Nocardioides iriomotensis]